MNNNQIKESFKQSIKIAFIGDSQVGKTSILNKFAFGVVSTPHPTVGAEYISREYEYENISYQLDLWDTAGQEQYRALTPLFYRYSDIIFIVCDITQKATIDHIDSWYREAKESSGTQNSSFILVGNKVDLLEKDRSNEEYFKEIGESLKMDYFIVSAKTGLNIDDLFYHAVSQGSQKFKETQTTTEVINSEAKPEKSSCC